MKVRGRRYLLNSSGHDSVAAIVAEVEDTSGWKEGCDSDGRPFTADSWFAPMVQLVISDCSRSISLGCDFTTYADRENALAKVDKLISALCAFRRGLRIEQRLYVERRKRQPRKHKEDAEAN